MRKKTVLISVGPTREYIDPIRFITNSSSGKLGCKIAEEFFKNKYKVIIISGPVEVKPRYKIETYYVNTTSQMFNMVKSIYPKVDIFVSTAAVCDFKPQKFFPYKLKKNKKTTMTIKLIPTVDILEYCGKNKKKQFVVGFALETDKQKAILYAKEKMKRKNLDIIVLNYKDTFNSNFIAPTLIFKTGEIKKYKKMSKHKFAKMLVKKIKNMVEVKNEQRET